MTVRTLREEDIPILEKIHEKNGYDFEFPAHKRIEFALSVVDEKDSPLAAIFMERTIEAHLICSKFDRPSSALNAIRSLHDAAAPIAKKMGYSSAQAALPPRIERAFGRRLIRYFGWAKTWTGYCIHF